MAITAEDMAAKIAKATVDMDRLKTVVNGNSTTTVTVDSGTVPTLAKFFAGAQTQVNNAISGVNSAKVAAEAAATAANQSKLDTQALLSSASIPGLGAPLSVMRTKLDGSGRENYDPNLVPTLSASGQSFGLPAADFNYPFRSGRFIVAGRWANGPLAVEGARKDSATWSYSNVVRSVVSNDTKLTPSAVSGTHTVVPGDGAIALANGEVGYFSCVAKASGYSNLRVAIDNYDYIVVDLNTGNVTRAPSDGSLMTYVTKVLENGHVYIAVYYAATGAFTFNAYLAIQDNTAGGGAVTFVGDGTSAVLVQTMGTSMQKCVATSGVIDVFWRTGNSYDYRYDLQVVNGLTYYRRATGAPARWEAWAVSFDETALNCPVAIAKTRLVDRNDVRDYLPGIDIFSSSGNAVDKFKAAADAFTDDGTAMSVLSVPRGRIRFGDTWLITKMGFKMRGAGKQHFGRPYGETTGGSAHPLTGTQIETVGAGNSRNWGDIDGGGAGDNADGKKPAIAIGMPGVELEGFSLITPRTGDASLIWSNGIRLLGVDGCRLRNFNIYGGWDHAALLLDATHSKLNTGLNAIINGFALAAARDSNLMSYGLTDNLFTDCELAGVSAFKLQGTTRSKGSAGQYTSNTWLWAPNGCSDTKLQNFRLYQLGDLTKRQAGGALIYLDYRMWTGSTPNNSGQNITFQNGRLDGAGKWAIYMENIDVVWFKQLFGETSGAYFDATATRNIIQRTGAGGPERYFDQCKMFFNYTTPTETNVTMSNNYFDGRGVIS